MKKLISGLLVSLLFVTFAHAIPGFTSYIADKSGEFVYYKDNSFTRESYIGILYYDESTYQIRYYSPEDKANLLPEKDIAILLTINPDSANWEMTGENILSNLITEKEDIDIVNYLHDILYEFSARRKKIADLSPSNEDYVINSTFKKNGLKRIQDFNQFGGKVSIIFDNMIPIFNIKSITDNTGTEVLECCITGQISSSEDKTFSQFKGFSKSNTKISKGTDEYKRAKSVTYKYNGKKLVLDSNWTQQMENFWILGNDSMITMGAMPIYSEDKTKNSIYIIRKLIESTNGSYSNLSNLELSYDSKKSSYRITALINQPENNNTIRNTKIISEGPVPSDKEGFILEGTQMNFFSISTYEKAYKANTSYFDKIILSYK